MRYLIVSALLVAAGCSGSSSGGGAEDACGDGTNCLEGGGGAGGSPSQQTCGESLLLTAPDNYDHCPVVEQTFGVKSNAPNTNCDFESFCVAVKCGDKDSLYDATGCRRLECETDTDCKGTQRCYETAPEACAPHEEIACCQVGDGCTCVTTAECGVERHCVEASELPD